MSQTESSTGADTDRPTTRDGVMIVGSITADLTTFSSRLPKPGETLLGDAFTLVLGGKGANQAVAAGLAGGSASMIGCVGDDLFSELVTTGLRDAGVDVAHVRTVTGPTGIAHIRVDGAGENDIVMVPLANSSLDETQIDVAFDALAPECSVMLTQLEIPWRLTQYAIRKARDAGLTVILDPAPAATLDDAIWPLVDIVTPNETEASILTGIEVVDEATAIDAGRHFVRLGARSALVTMAGAGAVLVTETEVTRFDAIPVDVVDTTAAGDAFAGYLGASIALGLDLPTAIGRSVAAGALAVTRRGASPSLPHRDEVDALLDATAPAASAQETITR